jgi:hypothetical protein
MATKASHPDIEFFDYLSGHAGAEQSRLIEEHLSSCGECASAAALIRAIKDEVLESKAAPGDQHPDVGELATFFYSPEAANASVARHVALCGPCAEEIAQYAAGERAASGQVPAGAAHSQVPASAWEMIRDWEQSSFANPKPASEVLSADLLEKLSRILSERVDSLRESPPVAPQRGVVRRVPVLIISRSGEVDSVEYFEESIEPTGARVLRHLEGSTHLDNRRVHALIDVGGIEPLVVTELIESDTLRIDQIEGLRDIRSADYFIVDEDED